MANIYPRLPARLRAYFRRRIALLEGGEMRSQTLRGLFAQHHGVHVGAHSYGCFDPDRFGPALKIGRYVSIGPGVRVFRRNHPLNRISLHPYFYGTDLGYCREETLPPSMLAIGDDAWIGANAIILPGCSEIGTGAVIGAGAVVTRDVLSFAIVAGNPARFLRFRFPDALRERIARSQWWRRHNIALMSSLPLLQSAASDQILDQFEKEISSA
jgi:acetyltransferase-like isoleucine patch superfamily enzyme